MKRKACSALVLPIFFVLPVWAQLAFAPLLEIGNERVRVVFPATLAVEEEQAQRLIEALEEQARLPGLPENVLSGETITISLASQRLQGRDAWSFEKQRVIALPLEEVFGWQDERLHSVIRHELAHLGMSAFLDFARTPVWLHEGFAEWAAGGLTCEGEARIRLDLIARRLQGSPPPRFTAPVAPGEARLSYDLFATVFEFIDDSMGGAVQSGLLLQGVRDYGPETGFERILGVNLSQLELSWQSYLSKRYQGELDDIVCNVGNQRDNP